MEQNVKTYFQLVQRNKISRHKFEMNPELLAEDFSSKPVPNFLRRGSVMPHSKAVKMMPVAA